MHMTHSMFDKANSKKIIRKFKATANLKAVRFDNIDSAVFICSIKLMMVSHGIVLKKGTQMAK